MVSCKFDLCALEGQSTQDQYRCTTYESLIDMCNDFALKNDKVFDFTGWRTTLNCRMLFIYFILNIFNINE
jgi:hypothetical protein